MKKDKLYFIYLIGFLLILALPLLSIAPAFHPPAWGKTIIFKIVLSILIFVFIEQLIFQKHDKQLFIILKKLLNRKSKLFWPFWLLVALFVIYFLATIFSLNPNFSFWGSPYRGGGFLNYAFCILFAILIFFILKPKHWQKIPDFVLIVGVLVALIAVSQKFALFKEYLATYAYRPVSTIGGSIFLASYMFLLVFLSFSLAITSKTKLSLPKKWWKGKKKFFYYSCFVLFLFVIILTASRSALLGVFVGFLFFALLFPNKNKFKKITYLKFLILIILFLGVLGVLGLKSQPQLVQNLKENKIFGVFFGRTWSVTGEFSIEDIFKSRLDGWKIGLMGIKDRPLLGYGPENFSIAFDRYYDPTLPGISRDPNLASSTSWWDRGHNFIIDHSINAGIPAVIIYLFLFGSLFYQLQKVKNNANPNYNQTGNPNNKLDNAIISHGIQATFIGYFIINFFSFDLFSSYLISFFLIGFSLYLIKENDMSEQEMLEIIEDKKQIFSAPKPWKNVIIFILFFILVWFIGFCNLKPLWINKEINKAVFLIDNYKCPEGIKRIDDLLDTRSFLDSYIRLQYIDIISDCTRRRAEGRLELSFKAIEILEQVTEIRPYYTRSWQYVGFYINKALETSQLTARELEPELRKNLIEKADSSFKRALELSPKRSKILYDWIILDINLDRFKQAEEKVNQCLILEPNSGRCLWAKAIIYINLDQLKQAGEYIEKAQESGYETRTRANIIQLINAYSKMIKKTGDSKYYHLLAGLYPKLIKSEPENVKFHASLAYIYKMIGEYDKAREQALIILKLSSKSKPNVENFLKTLPFPYNKI